MVVLPTSLACAQMVATYPANDPVAVRVSQVVLGIISYTNWPTEMSRYRLCVIGQPDYAADLYVSDAQVRGISVSAQHVTISDDHIGKNCDIVYSGALTVDEVNSLRTELTGHPVLTITEQDDDCSDIRMFCLVVQGRNVSFAVNLDSVARSGVEVNPQVLLLARSQSTQP
jgi:YfiR/HmsC-like